MKALNLNFRIEQFEKKENEIFQVITEQMKESVRHLKLINRQQTKNMIEVKDMLLESLQVYDEKYHSVACNTVI